MADEIAVGIALTTDPDRSRELLDEFCRCLAAVTGVKVTAHGMWHYHHLLEALAVQDLDLVWLPPLLALRAVARAKCVPVAVPVRHGLSTYSSALICRPDSPIRSLDDLKEVRAAWVDRQSAAGYLIIRALLRAKKVDLDAAFSHEKFLGTHDAVAAAVLDREVDVGATFAHFPPDGDPSTDEPTAAGWGDADVHIICSAGPIPSDIIAANRSLATGTREAVQRALVELSDPELATAARELLGADSFIAPTKEHLASLRNILDNLEESPGRGNSVFPPSRRK
ncbi:MAG: phosphate/phosphite/phosphonate ABC transporter substrate-binding protein [Deltaproteobacteria bacterium]|nr:phosphate/phosphite/phosphonate ABC transporter substrate-binding protein [Deltaproteobacteria bacterium]